MNYDDRMREQVLTRCAFQNTLRETIAWCATRFDAGNPSGSLRSVELRPDPSPTDTNLREFGGQLVSQVAEKRRAALSVLYHRAPLNAAGGRLLVVNSLLLLAWGLATEGTRGFFSPDDLPPWDCWVAYFASGFLASWIPQPMLTQVENGAIRTEPCDAFGWADEDPNIEWRDIWKMLQ